MALRLSDLALLCVLLAAGAHWVWDHQQKLKADALSNQPPARICAAQKDDAAVQRFSRALTFQTLGDANTADHIKPGYEQHFSAMLDFLEQSYPLVYASLKVEKVGLGNWSLLYTWEVKNSSLLPVLFISHYDVVPVASGTEQDWTHPPFSGHIADEYVYGRGALDVKFGVMALLEALTQLLKQGFKPTRTLMMTFGHDEEIGGKGGAAKVAELLASRNVTLDAVIDEGGFVLADGLRGFTKEPMALIGTAEKLYTSVQVTLRSGGGHSSFPPVDGSDVGSQLGSLLVYLAKHRPPAQLRQPIIDFFKALAPSAAPGVATVFHYSETWPLQWLLATALGMAGPEGNALVRTTLAATRIEMGVADNVLPISGSVTYNIRSHPSVPRQEVLDFIQDALYAAGLRGQVEVTNMTHFAPPADVASTTGRHFKLLKQAIQEYYRHGNKAVSVVPFMLTGGTDSKHFAPLSKHGILRFVPYELNKTEGDLEGIHSTNERARVSSYLKAICVYQRMLELATSS